MHETARWPESQPLAKELVANETDVLPAYAPDDGPLTAKQVQALRDDATGHFPNGKVLSKRYCLFEPKLEPGGVVCMPPKDC